MKTHIQKHKHHYIQAGCGLLGVTLGCGLLMAGSMLFLSRQVSYATAISLACDGFSNVAVGNGTYKLSATVKNTSYQTYYPYDNRINGTYFDSQLSVDGGQEGQYGTTSASVSGANGSVPPGGTATQTTSNAVALPAGTTHSLRWRFRDVHFSTIITCATSFTTPAPAHKPAPPKKSTAKPKPAPTSTTAPIQGSTPISHSSTSATSQPAYSVNTATQTTPPPKPAGFTALPGQGSAVQLSWMPGLLATSYKLERSADNKTWLTLQSSLIDTNYTDTATDFATTFYYRLTAADSQGRTSKPVVAKVVTNDFVYNAGKAKTLTLHSPDGLLTVVIPASALQQPANCRFADLVTLPLYSIKDYSTTVGSYQLICQQQDNVVLTSFAVPLTATLTLTDAVSSKYSTYALAGFNEAKQSWQQVSFGGDGQPKTLVKFKLDSAFTGLTVFAKPKHTPFIVGFLTMTAILIATAAVGLVALKQFMRYQVRRSIRLTEEDYWHKMNGV